MRVAVDVLRVEAHSRQQIGHRAAHVAAVADPVHAKRRAHDLTQSLAGIERGVGILEHDLKLAAKRPHLATAE